MTSNNKYYWAMAANNQVAVFYPFVNFNHATIWKEKMKHGHLKNYGPVSKTGISERKITETKVRIFAAKNFPHHLVTIKGIGLTWQHQ